MLRWCLILLAGLVLADPSVARDKRGGPVRTMLTGAEQPIPVDVTWLQSGGVVMLKIVSANPLETDKRDKTVEEAQKLVEKFVGARATLRGNGQLMMSFRMVGWTKPFTANDLAIAAPPKPVN
jgi:hypothetical protein